MTPSIHTENAPLVFNSAADVDTLHLYRADLSAALTALKEAPADMRTELRMYYLNLLEDKWRPRLGYVRDQIKQHLHQIEFPVTETKADYTLSEILTEDDTGTDWLIPGLLPRIGLQLLGGLPKVGKSVYTYMLAFGVAHSGEFLGLPVRKGNVLFIQAEEGIELAKRRLRLCGFGQTEIAKMFRSNGSATSLVLRRTFNLRNDLGWLKKTIARGEYSLVIIDSLRKVTATEADNENSAEFGKLVAGLQSTINDAGTAAILIHHMRKPDSMKSEDITPMFSGSTAIAAAPDGLMALTPDTVNGCVLLRTLPRDGVAIKLRYTWGFTDDGNWKLTCIDNAGLLGGDSVLPLRILRLLSGNAHGLTLYQLFDRLNLDKSDAEAHKTVQFLQSLSIILVRHTEVGRLLYMSEESSWLIGAADSTVSTTLSDANTLTACADRQALRSATTGWLPARFTQALHATFGSERENIEKLLKTPTYTVGQQVICDDQECVVEQVIEGGRLHEQEYVVSIYTDKVLEEELRAVHTD